MPAPADPTRPLRAAYLAAVDAAVAAKAAAAAAYADARAGIPAVAGLADVASDAADAAEAARRAWIESDEPREYLIRDDSGDWTVTSTPDDVVDAVREGIAESGDPNPNETTWYNVAIFVVGGDGGGEVDLHVDNAKIQIDPEEPACEASEHTWVSPYWLLGGLENNPGVVGHGGGVIVTEACRDCGCQRTTDTWAQDPYDGTQGHRVVTYDPSRYWHDFYERGEKAAERGDDVDLTKKGIPYREGYEAARRRKAG